MDAQPKLNRISKEPSGPLLNWVNGAPVPVYSPPRDNQQIGQLARASLSMEYKPKTILVDDVEVIDPKEKDYAKHTNMEVMFMKASQAGAEGDIDAASFVLDRVLGKPKQFSESIIINTTLAEALDQIADAIEAESAVDVTPTDDAWSVLD